MSKPRDFINRNHEFALFKRMLAHQTPEQVLTILAETQKGKSYFMKYLYGHCLEQNLTTAFINFDRRDTLISIERFMKELCDHIDPAVWSNVEGCHSPEAITSLKTGSGTGQVAWGQENQFQQSQVAGMAGRDYIHAETHLHYQPSASEIATRQARFHDELGRALRRDLSELTRQQPVILFFDTFEQATQETSAWLEEWLFKSLARYPHLFVILAGQPQLRDKFQPPQDWHTLMRIIPSLPPPEAADLTLYAEMWQIPLEHLPLLVTVAKSNMSTLAKIRDVYREQAL